MNLTRTQANILRFIFWAAFGIASTVVFDFGKPHIPTVTTVCAAFVFAMGLAQVSRKGCVTNVTAKR